MRLPLFLLLTLIAIALPMLNADAAETKQIDAEQIVERRVIKVDPAGFETVTFETAKLVKPGDYLRYSIHYENNLDAPAENIILTMPVPEVMDYVVGSAAPKSYPYEVSFDAGATFKLAEESTFSPDRRVTHIRWQLEHTVAPGESGTVSVDALLR